MRKKNKSKNKPLSNDNNSNSSNSGIITTIYSAACAWPPYLSLSTGVAGPYYHLLTKCTDGEGQVFNDSLSQAAPAFLIDDDNNYDNNTTSILQCMDICGEWECNPSACFGGR